LYTHRPDPCHPEFLAATLEAQGNIAQHKIAECFDELDDDDTGFISRENLRRILPKTMPSQKIDELIAAIDSEDMDGKISFEEFRRAFVDENQSKIGGLYAATSEAS
jgi:Ca2+-binding EF-hand superfamily protein